MAMRNIFGTFLKQRSVSSGQVPLNSMLTAFRAMSSQKLFVGGLPWAADDQALREAFASFGEVTEARVILDRESGRSRGFGFVSFADTESATSALAMDGQELKGRSIRVSFAENRTGPPRGGGFNNSGGNYGY